MSHASNTEYFRRDNPANITPPNPAANFTFIEHIAKARGKKSQFTSISDSLDKIKHFSGVDYRLDHETLIAHLHSIVSHEDLLAAVGNEMATLSGRDKIQAVRAKMNVIKNKESLIKWDFLKLVETQITATLVSKIQVFFSKV